MNNTTKKCSDSQYIDWRMEDNPNNDYEYIHLQVCNLDLVAYGHLSEDNEEEIASNCDEYLLTQ
jgi:hypothetical protein